MTARRDKSGSYGVFSSTTAIESVPDYHRPTFRRTQQPQLDGRAYVDAEVRHQVRPKHFGGLVGDQAGELAKPRNAPLYGRDYCTYNRLHDEKPVGDGPENRKLAEFFRPMPFNPPDVPFSLLAGQTVYQSTFQKYSKRGLRNAKQAPKEQTSFGDPTRCAGYTAPMKSHSHDDAPRAWLQPDLKVRGQRSGSTCNIQSLGVFTKGALRSQSQIDFPAREDLCEASRRLLQSAPAGTSTSRPKGPRGERAKTTASLGMLGVGTCIENLDMFDL
eukprot:TRINITY_DN56336_c0_g1_i1.p1 TRINITY_DN56336_c0_g1~~TRINITY_DN56336_c0_g1_i1.p1  ORF type:complete len:273 (+),score=29.49 TRINITY_DN56336_c0_g1_i1:169-987(+)